MNEEIKIEETIGFQLAMSFKPFIDPNCGEHMEIVKDMAKAINNVCKKSVNQPTEDSADILVLRVKQFLTVLDYDGLTNFQKDCAALLERDLKAFEELNK